MTKVLAALLVSFLALNSLYDFSAGYTVQAAGKKSENSRGPAWDDESAPAAAATTTTPTTAAPSDNGAAASGMSSGDFAPENDSASCCRVCTKGKACGDSCIARWKSCLKEPGCACNGG